MSVKVVTVRLSDRVYMSSDKDENENFEKMFNEIVNSDDLKDISDLFQKSLELGIKELLIIQQALCDSVSNISEMLIEFYKNPSNKLNSDDERFQLLGSLYKISEDFNDHMIECMETVIVGFEEDEDDLDVLFDLEESEYDNEDDEFGED